MGSVTFDGNRQDPPTSAGTSLEERKLVADIELRRAEIAIKERELTLKEDESKRSERELTLKEKESNRSRLLNPTLIGLAAATLGLVGNMFATMAGNRNAQAVEHSRAQSSLIVQAASTGKSESACENLRRFVKLGFLDDPKGLIANCQVPVLPPPPAQSPIAQNHYPDQNHTIAQNLAPEQSRTTTDQDHHSVVQNPTSAQNQTPQQNPTTAQNHAPDQNHAAIGRLISVYLHNATQQAQRFAVVDNVTGKTVFDGDLKEDEVKLVKVALGSNGEADVTYTPEGGITIRKIGLEDSDTIDMN